MPKFTWNSKSIKGSISKIWTLQAKISCPELLNSFRFVLTSVKMLCSGFKRNIEFAWNSPKQKSLFTVLNGWNSWAKVRKSFHISHFQSTCEIFENRSRLVELNFSKYQIDLTRKNSWWWSLKFKIKQDNLFFEQKCCNEFLNFHEYWFKHLHHMHNIHIRIFLEDICKTRNFHLHHHLAAFTSTCPCWGKSIHHKHIHLHLHPHEGHLHYKYLHSKKSSFALSHMDAFMSAYPKRIFALDIPWTKHLHLHLHLHPHEGHLHNKIFICTIIRLRSCMHIQ